MGLFNMKNYFIDLDDGVILNVTLSFFFIKYNISASETGKQGGAL